MENLAAKRSRAAAAADDSKEDRLSKLPEAILHHILCFLDQRDAATTSVLSKSWRYLWCTRPIVDFRHGVTVVAGENKESFISVLDRTLRGYHDRKIRLEHLILHLSPSDVETFTFLINWFRILTQGLGVNLFHLHFLPENQSSNTKIQLPLSSIFGSESVQDLSLESCALKQISAPPPPVHLDYLQVLALNDVEIPEEILDDILSSCRFLEHVSLVRCTGFKRIKLKPPAAYLKEIYFCGHHQIGSTSIAMGDVDIPTLKVIQFFDCSLTINPNHPFYFSHLTHLTMQNVKLSSDLFSCDLPCLEELRLYLCSGIKEFNLSSPSMKLMEIINTDNPFKATVDAPSIVSFRYHGVLPQSISFLTTAAAANSWTSYICLTHYLTESSLCLNDLIGVIKALSQSKISLSLDGKTLLWLGNQIHDMNVGVSYADLPVAVGQLSIFQDTHSPFPNELLNTLFHMIRPKIIIMSDFQKPLLKGVSMQFFSWNGGKWQPFQPTSFDIITSENGECEVETCLPVGKERTIPLLIY